MKPFVSAALEVTGLMVFAAGLWILAPWLGIAVAGIGLVAIGVSVDPPERVTYRQDGES